MSILDTFFLLFRTDADDAARDVDDLGDAADDAVDDLGDLENAADNVGSSFLDMAQSLAGPLLALASIGTLVSAVVERAAETRRLDQFASKLNSTIEDVDAFQRVVTSMGGETEGALDSLSKVAEKVNEAFSDAASGAATDFAAWGLSIRGVNGEALSASEGLLALAENLEGVSRAEALARIKKLGIEDAGTIDALLKGRAALEERIAAEKQLGVVTQEQAALTRDYYSAMGSVENILTSIGNRLLTALLPAITAVTEAFSGFISWMVDHQTLVTGFFIAVAGVVAAIYLPAIAAAAAATLVAIAPFLLIGAAIGAVGAAFALAYEDVTAFLNGQPSLIGALSDKYEWFAAILDGIAVGYQMLKDGGVAALEALAKAWDYVLVSVDTTLRGFESFWGAVKPILLAVGDAVSAIGELFAAIGSRISDGLAPVVQVLGEVFSAMATSAGEALSGILDSLSPLGAAMTGIADLIRGVFAGAFDFVRAAWDATIGGLVSGITAFAGQVRGIASWVRGDDGESGEVSTAETSRAVRRGRGAIQAATSAPINGATPASLAAGAAGSTTSTTNTVTVGEVTVNTQATDAPGVAAAVREELQTQLRGTASQLDDGVDR